MLLRVIEEVGPVGICLHEVELKQLSQAQYQDVVADLGTHTRQFGDLGQGRSPTLLSHLHSVQVPQGFKAIIHSSPEKLREPTHTSFRIS